MALMKKTCFLDIVLDSLVKAAFSTRLALRSSEGLLDC